MGEAWTKEPALAVQVELAQNRLRSDGLVVITGPSGSGKSRLAFWLHEHSPRGKGAFVIQEAAGLADSLCESRLFGHKKGAFSGAILDQTGLAALAQQGTLCLENIDDLPHSTQAKLLRFIQERRFRPIGALAETQFTGQLIFSSRLPASRLADVLREDFYFRLVGHELALPTHRPLDHDDLFESLRQEVLRDFSHPRYMPSHSDREALRNRPLNGNLHGMRRLLLQSVMRATPVADLLREEGEADWQFGQELPNTGNLKQDLLLLEQRLLRRALASHQGTRQELADQLGISLRSLLYKLKSLE